jgi:FG-GAP-like repeat
MRYLLALSLALALASSAAAEDCDKDGIADPNAIAMGLVPDCNGNIVPDYCDIWVYFTSDDCNNNGVPDDCETDCNNNAIPDDCDILSGTSADCDGDRVPDECQTPPTLDCNANGVSDVCDVRRPLAFNAATLEFAIDHSGFALNPIDIAIGDMNGDGRPDIVSANRSFPLGHSVGVFLALPAGGFAAAPVYDAGIECEGLALADFDADGDLDVAVTVRRFSQNGIDVLLNDGAGVLSHHAALNVGSYLIDVQAALLRSSDLRPDIVAADINAARVAILTGLGGGNFAAPTYVTVGQRPIQLAIGRIDADTGDDIVVSVQGDGGKVVVLRQDDNFAVPMSYPVPDNEGGGNVAIADFDNDGDNDVVLAQQGYKRVVFYRNIDAAGTLAAPIVSTGPADNIVSLAAADLDADGRIDVAVTTSSGFYPNGDPRPGYLCVMSGRGDGTFFGPLAWLAGDSPLSLAIGNLDADMRPDVAVGVYQTEVVRLYTNATDAASSGDVNRNFVPDECECIGDVNADQRVDLADLSILLANFGGSGTPSSGDIDASGVVDLADLALLLARFGSVCA